ncbi:MAG TPA: chemotaxis protein CheW [Terriglobales bacterium]|jgi:chemotaxis signal transduction protein|nr:chemotaxis protein CheW [Terriglobales bacterium]
MNSSRSRNIGSRFKPRSGETVILFSVGGAKFAIAASAVEEIRDLAGLQKLGLGVQQRFAKVKQTLERQGQRYFVVDTSEHFHLVAVRPSRVLILRHARAAVIADAIDCMHELNSMQALPRAFSGEERNWYRGLALVKGRVIPVVRPEAFLSKVEVALIEASMRDRETAGQVVSRA